jgi:hypothetical protein
MPVHLGEPGDAEFLGDRLSGTRARDATAHVSSRQYLIGQSSMMKGMTVIG